MDDLISLPEAAIILGVGWATVKRWCDDGHIAFTTVAGRRYVFRAALKGFVRPHWEGKRGRPPGSKNKAEREREKVREGRKR